MSVFEKLYLLLFNAVTDALRLMQSGHAQAAAELLVRAQQACEELYRVSAQRRYARKKASLAQREVARRSRDGGIAVHRAAGLKATPQSAPLTAPLAQGSLSRGKPLGRVSPLGPCPLFCKKRGKKLQTRGAQ